MVRLLLWSDVIFAANSPEKGQEAPHHPGVTLTPHHVGAKFYNFGLYYHHKLFWKFNLKCIYMIRQYMKTHFTTFTNTHNIRILILGILHLTFLTPNTLFGLRNPNFGGVILLKLFNPSCGFRDIQDWFCTKMAVLDISNF